MDCFGFISFYLIITLKCQFDNNYLEMITKTTFFLEYFWKWTLTKGCAFLTLHIRLSLFLLAWGTIVQIVVWFDFMTKHAGDTPQTRKAWRGIMWDAQTACCEVSPIGDELWAVLSLTAKEYHSCITHPDTSTGNITDNDGAVCKYLESGAYFFFPPFLNNHHCWVVDPKGNQQDIKDVTSWGWDRCVSHTTHSIINTPWWDRE